MEKKNNIIIMIHGCLRRVENAHCAFFGSLCIIIFSSLIRPTLTLNPAIWSKRSRHINQTSMNVLAKQKDKAMYGFVLRADLLNKTACLRPTQLASWFLNSF